MGGRIALEALLYHNAPFLSLSCLSTTLENPDRKSRQKQEEQWIKKLSTTSLEEFIKYWYSQPIFNTFTPPKRRFKQNKENLLKVLKNYSSLKSPPFIEKIKLCKTPLFFLYRTNDPKAIPIQQLPNTHFIEASSHCIHLENPSACAKTLESIYSALIARLS